LERELASVKERIGVIDADMKNLPDLIKIEFRLVESRLARVLHDLQDTSISGSLRSTNASMPWSGNR
jgi:hypothetical protein